LALEGAVYEAGGRRSAKSEIRFTTSVGTSNPTAAARAAYGQQFQERRAALVALARRLRAALIPLSAIDDPMRVLHALGNGHFPQAPRWPRPRSNPA
jgi:hypothetical protein